MDSDKLIDIASRHMMNIYKEVESPGEILILAGLIHTLTIMNCQELQMKDAYFLIPTNKEE